MPLCLRVIMLACVYVCVIINACMFTKLYRTINMKCPVLTVYECFVCFDLSVFVLHYCERHFKGWNLVQRMT